MKTEKRDVPQYSIAFRDDVSNNLLNFGSHEDEDYSLVKMEGNHEVFDILIRNSLDDANIQIVLKVLELKT